MKTGLILLLFFLFPQLVFAHPGKTASDDCHYCRTNCDRWGVPWGERHCHGGYTQTVPQIYVQPSSTPTPKPRQTSTPTPLPINTPTPTFIPTLEPTLTFSPETLGVKTESKKESGSPLGSLVTLGIFGGLGYWIFKKIKGSKDKKTEEN